MSDFKNIDGPEWLDYAARELAKSRRSDRGGNVVLLLFSIPATVFITAIGLLAFNVAIAGRYDAKAGMNESFLLMATAPLVVVFGILSMFVLSRRGVGFAWWYNLLSNAVSIAVLCLIYCTTLAD